VKLFIIFHFFQIKLSAASKTFIRFVFFPKNIKTIRLFLERQRAQNFCRKTNLRIIIEKALFISHILLDIYSPVKAFIQSS